jgi:dihydroorotase
MQKLLLLFFLAGALFRAQAQPYTIVIKGGQVIDPKNNINERMDVAIQDGKIVRLAKSIDPKQAIQVVDATGLYVVPGLIDIHTHTFYGPDPERAYSNGTSSIVPDGFTFRVGVTTVVDAGCSGWRDFAVFKRQVIDQSQTRVLAFMNIVGSGMRGGVYEQDTADMDGKLTGMTARRYHDYVVGIKVAHYSGPEWHPIDEAVKAGRLANIPVMIDFGGNNPPLSIEELFLHRLRPGDIFTHCFGQLTTREPIVDITKDSVKPFVWAARKKGIVFDVGYGGISFAFSQAIPAIRSGFYPNSISTDIHGASTNGSMMDILNIMSKFLAMGVSLEEVIRETTWNPAQEIHHEELGNLSAGGIADVTILRVREGKFGFYDYTGRKLSSNHKLENELTIKGGKIVYDLDGIVDPLVLPPPVRPNSAAPLPLEH